MNDYLYLMHDDADQSGGVDWESYLSKLKQNGHFGGGSAIGSGECVNKSGSTAGISRHLTGYLRIQAENLSQAKALLEGNPVFEAGGTVEIRELPRG